MSEKRLLNALLAVGFTQNMAKAYMVLLEESPLSGYAVALKAGVTRARTYDALDRLVELGYVRSRPGRPVMYALVPIEEIVSYQKNTETQNVERAKKALSKLEPKHSPLESMICITGYYTILQNVLSSIDNAKETIYLYIRKEEYEQLRGKLQEAAQRGVQINAVFAVDQESDIVCDFASDFTYVQRLNSEQARQGNRWTIIALDNQAGFIGITSRGEDSVAVSTFNSAYVAFLISNIATYFVERDYMAITNGHRFTSAENSAYSHLRRELALQ